MDQMSFDQAERHFVELQKQRDDGQLDAEAFRVEVAKLLLRDEQGTFWMLDAEDRTWFCNRGTGWEPGDPHAVQPLRAGELVSHQARRPSPLLILGAILVALLATVGVLALLRWPPGLWPGAPPSQGQEAAVQVAIASPADGSQVVMGHEAAIESTLTAASGLEAVERVELRVDGRTVDSQPVRSRLQPQQTSLPLSLPWLPAAAGEHVLTVAALSQNGAPLGEASVTLYAEAAGSSVSPACTLDATFLADVTIPPGSPFPPGARMDKVWQVRNSGTCAWGVGYELVLVEGESLGAPSTVPVPPTAAGGPADLAITFWAPAEAGPHTGVWQLQSPDAGFFGPALTLDILVTVRAEENAPPAAPTDLQAAVTEDGQTVRLSWVDQSDREDAFRVYREDVEASIGLAPVNAGFFVDEDVVCGNTYRYAVVAFNAAGPSPISETAEVALPPCSSAGALPTITLTVAPTQVVASQIFTLTFDANDNRGVAQVIIRGEDTGDPDLDLGRTFACAQATCSGQWPFLWTGEMSATLTVVASALDTSGQESEPARVTIFVLPSE